MEKDKNSHIYMEVSNIRITYVPSADRTENSDWAGHDVLRIQAYQNDTNKRLHNGAELPIETPDRFIEFISALCTVYNNGRS
jgi:hypothetical protein